MDYSHKEDIIEQMFEKFRLNFLRSNLLLYFAILILLLKIFTITEIINLSKEAFFADITKSSLVNYINQARMSSGVPALTENIVLDQAAQLKAQNMLQNQYFAHTSPQGISPWYWFSKAGYNYKYAGENLAVGFFDSWQVYEAWLNSPSHKSNLMNPLYKEVGTAVLSGFGNNNAIIVVQLFGAQQPVKIAAVGNAKTKQPPQVSVKEENPAQPGAQERRVLAQSIDASFETPKNNSDASLQSRIINMIIYNYGKLVDDAFFAVSFFLLLLTAVAAYLNREASDRALIARSTAAAVLLIIALAMDYSLIAPSQIAI